MAKAEPTTAQELEQELGAVIGLVNLMQASLPCSRGMKPCRRIHTISARYEAVCRKVYEALRKEDPRFAHLVLEFECLYQTPKFNRLIVCRWDAHREIAT